MKTFKCRVCGEEKTGSSPAVLLSHYDEHHPEVRAEKKAARAAAKAAAAADEPQQDTDEAVDTEDDSHCAAYTEDDEGPERDESDEGEGEGEPVSETDLIAEVCNWFDIADLDATAARRVINYLMSRYAPAPPAVQYYINGVPQTIPAVTWQQLPAVSGLT